MDLAEKIGEARRMARKQRANECLHPAAWGPECFNFISDNRKLYNAVLKEELSREGFDGPGLWFLNNLNNKGE